MIRIVYYTKRKEYLLKSLKKDLDIIKYKRQFIQEFIDGTYTMSWDKTRWDKLRKLGWIEVWRHRNRTTIKYSVFKTSFKFRFNRDSDSFYIIYIYNFFHEKCVFLIYNII